AQGVAGDRGGGLRRARRAVRGRGRARLPARRRCRAPAPRSRRRTRRCPRRPRHRSRRSRRAPARRRGPCARRSPSRAASPWCRRQPSGPWGAAGRRPPWQRWRRRAGRRREAGSLPASSGVLERVDEAGVVDLGHVGAHRRRVPVHRSLLTRVVVLALAVCTVSVAATAWLVVRSTGVAVQQVQGQNLRSDAIVYAGLLDHASTHPDWTGVGPLLDDLAAQTDYRIVLTAMDGTVVADSGGTADPGAAPAAEDTRVVVDPAPVDDALLRHPPGHGADPGTTVPTPAEAAVAGEATAAPVAPAETAVPAHGPDAAQASPTAPPVRLFVTGREPYATTFLDLSLANRVRIVGLAGGVLLVAAGVSL